jgi:disulfide oxidoreductase YuzD
MSKSILASAFVLQQRLPPEVLMLHIIRNLVLFFALLKFSPPLWAANFGSEMKNLTVYCTSKTCQSPYEMRTIDLSDAAPSVIQKDLKNAAIEQAQIWADTILEGDYVSDGRTRLDQAFAIYRNAQLVSYFITYSEGAWDVSLCHYDGQSNDTLNDCKRGRIVESVYLSPDLNNTFFTDENYARFIEL